MENKNLPSQFRLENIREYLVTLWSGETHEITAKMAGNIAMAQDKNDEFADKEKGFYFKKSAVSAIKRIRNAKREVAEYLEKQKKLEQSKKDEEKRKNQEIAIKKFEKENPNLKEICEKKAKEYISKFEKIPSSAEKMYYKVFLRAEYKKIHNLI